MAKLHIIAFLLFKYILLVMLLQLYQFFSPLYLPPPCTSPPASIPLPYFKPMGCTYKFFGFSISYSILNLCLFWTYQLCFLFPVPFAPILLLPLPTDNPPCHLHFCDSVPVPVICLVFIFGFWVQLLIVMSLLSFCCHSF